MSKITMFHNNIFSHVCSDEHILIPGGCLIFIPKNLFLQAPMITLAASIYCNNFSSLGLQKDRLSCFNHLAYLHEEVNSVNVLL